MNKLFLTLMSEAVQDSRAVSDMTEGVIKGRIKLSEVNALANNPKTSRRTARIARRTLRRLNLEDNL